jgi:hypothetical protein
MSGNLSLRGKWSFEGARTLSEAAEALRALAAEMERLESEGWQFRQPVEDDYGWLVKTRPGKRESSLPEDYMPNSDGPWRAVTTGGEKWKGSAI